MTITAVLFDGDDTLWEFSVAMRVALAATLDELWARRPGSRAAALSVNRLIEIRNRVAGELAGRVIDLAMVRLAAFERSLEEVDLPDPALAADLTASFFGHLGRHLRLFPDTVACLDAVAHLDLAVVTNGTAHPDDFGIGDRFRAVVRASDVGHAKPDPAGVIEAIRQLGADPAGTVLVGDSIDHDVGAARSAGIQAILVDRTSTLSPPYGMPVLESLSGLADLLDKLSGGRTDR